MTRVVHVWHQVMADAPVLPLTTTDPVIAAEDRVAAWIEQADEFTQATMVRQLSLRGWSHERAHAVVQRVWNQMGRK